MRRLFVLLLLAATASLVPTVVAAAATEPARPGPARIPDRYIVVYRDQVADPGRKTDQFERQGGFRSRHRYSRAVKGFSAVMPEGRAQAIARDPDVIAVVQDAVVRATSASVTPGETVPAGVRRIDAASTAAVRGAAARNVAVVDSGIDLTHPDLNVVDAVNCVAGGTANDDNGHGTHVAGTIAARNDGAGVAGVAPNTRLAAVKVLDAAGNGAWSDVVCGLDWITATRTDSDPSNDIAVANLSLSGPGAPVQSCGSTSDPLHLAVCRTTAAGVAIVAAAGNDGWDFDYASVPDVPAAYPEVLTVAAMTDSDGVPGGTGPIPACDAGQADDRYATFSNFAATQAGAAHLVAAPGSCVTSTWPGGQYAVVSGTSMAAPHVAGAVALCLGEVGGPSGPCAGLTPSQIQQRILSDAAADPARGFVGDRSRPVSGVTFGDLVRVAAPDVTRPTVSAVAPVNGATGIATTTSVQVTFSEPMDRTATAAAVSVARTGTGPIAGTATWSTTGTTLTFKPTSALASGADYVVTVTTGARDQAWNSMAAPSTTSFRTASAPATAGPAAVAIEKGSLRAGGAAQLAADDGALLQIGSTTTSTFTTQWYGRFTGIENGATALSVTARNRYSRSCTQVVYLYRWTTATWVAVDQRAVGTTEVGVTVRPPSGIADYISGTSGPGEVRARVRCTTTGGTFVSYSDQLLISATRP